MSKTVQLGFRCTPELADHLRQLAHDGRTSVQAILDLALDQHLGSIGQGKAMRSDALSSLSAREEELVSDFIDALRHGDADLVDVMVRQVRSTKRLAEKRKRETTTRNRGDARKVG